MADPARSAWPKTIIKDLAATSGKPLEVVCGQAFLASPAAWNPRLGSYFQDGDKVRELDVLAERSESLQDRGVVCRLRVLVSCRGFPMDASPLAYSILATSPLVLQPKLLVGYRRPSSHVDIRDENQVAASLGVDMASTLLELSGLKQTRPIVGLDVVKQEKQGKAGTVEYNYKLKGDEAIYGAIDSAVKSAVYWNEADSRGTIGGHVTLNVPLCVLATPFWDVSIEGGAVSDPEQLVSGYQTNAYPLPAPLHGHTVEHTPLTIIILSHTALPGIVKALDDLFDSFKGAFLQATSSMRRKHDH